MSNQKSKQLSYNVDARDALKRGVDKLANAVKVTLGPKGRNVIIDRDYGDPHVTKDGVTVAKAIFLADVIENMGAQMVKSVASKTAEVAGDGTTTATVLAQAIITAGLKNVAAGANPMDLKRGIDKAVEIVVNDLKKQSEEVGDDYEKIQQVATISANNDVVIGKLIADAMGKVGKDGVITIEEASGMETTVETSDGLQFDKGYSSNYFVTDSAKMEAILDNPYILLCDKKISVAKDLLPIFNKIVKEKESTASKIRPILIISEDLSPEVLSALCLNKVKGGFEICAVKSPGYKDLKADIMQDIAILTGAEIVSEERGYTLAGDGIRLLGAAGKITVTRETTTIVSGKGDALKIKQRIDDLKENIKIATDDFTKGKLKERLAKLSGGVAVLHIGAASEVEMREKIDRVDDALHATRAAVEEGIVGGGGIALIRAIESLKNAKGDNEDENTGIQIIRRAIEEPLRQICENAGIEGSVIVQKVKDGKKDFGYNARTDVFENMIKAGVIDPTKVVRVALQNAASIGAMILTTECVLANEQEIVDAIK